MIHSRKFVKIILCSFENSIFAFGFGAGFSSGFDSGSGFGSGSSQFLVPVSVENLVIFCSVPDPAEISVQVDH